MKAILMSDRPKWCALMMNGDKTIEVRKGTALYKAIQKLIDEYGYAEIYVYCTKGKEDLRKSKWFGDYILTPKMSNYRDKVLDGKVIFKFRCYKVEEILIAKTLGVPVRFTKSLCERDLCKAACLTPYDFKDYLGNKLGYAIHISDLEIFDKPKELSEFFKCDGKPNYALFGSSHYELANRRIIKAPQSWCYVEAEDLIKEY